VGDKTPDNPKTQEKSLNRENKASDGDKKSKSVNSTLNAQKPAKSPQNNSDGQKIPVADCPPTVREVQNYMQQRGEQGDPFRHITAEEFYDDGCQNGWTIRGGQPLYDWRARLRSLEGYRRKNGEQPVTQEGYVAYRDGKLAGTLSVKNNNNQRHEGSTDNRRTAYGGAGRNQEQDVIDGREQTLRIINRIRADRDASEAGGGGTDQGGDPF
jgi:hypothetical protein